MNTIVFKKRLSADVWEMAFEAPDIAREHKAGQFLIVQVDHDWGERVPLTIADADEAAGNHVTSILAARTKDLLIFEDRMRAASDEVIVCTDDGSYGRKDLVTAPLKELCESATPPDRVIAIGPPIMMKFCAATTKPFGIPTMVSLNTIMIDGTGMCGGCRVSVGGKIRFVCVEGPDFDGHQVDWDNMLKRMRAFKPFQALAKQRELDHECRLVAAAEEVTGPLSV